MIQLKKLWQKGYLLIGAAALIWLIFLIHPNVGIYDWDKEIAYFDVIRVSLTQYHSLPFIWWNPQGLVNYPAIGQSIFFLANPETFVFSPFILLLFFVDTLVFIKILSFCMFLLGIWGIFLLGKRMQWDETRLRLLFASFLLSPIIMQHVAIGYLPWLNLFLFPWLIYFLLEKKWIKRSLGSAAILSLVLLQGGLHVFVWFVFFVIFFYFVRFASTHDWRQIVGIFMLFLFVILLSCVRLTTSAKVFSDYSQTFFQGFTPACLVNWGFSLPLFFPPTMDDIESFIESYCEGAPYWDASMYWGVMLILFWVLLVLIGKKWFFHNSQESDSDNPLIRSVLFASCILLLFSLDGIYQAFITFFSNILHFPALEGMEKYPFRFAILSYYGISICVVHYFNDLMLLLTGWIQKAGQYFSQCTQRVISISRYRKVGKTLLIGFSIFVSIILLFELFKESIYGRIHALVEQSYEGEGYAWVTNLMSHRLSIPLDAYLSKTDGLLRILASIFLIITIAMGAIGIGLINLRKFQQCINRGLAIIRNGLPIFVEVLIVLPLLWASCMWLRVAIATPTDDYLPMKLLSPDVRTEPSSFRPKIVLHPGSLEIYPMYGKLHEVVFPNIRHSDNTFLDIHGGSFIESREGSLAIIPENQGAIKVAIRSNSYLPALLITCASWVVFISSFFYWRMKDVKATRRVH